MCVCECVCVNVYVCVCVNGRRGLLRGSPWAFDEEGSPEFATSYSDNYE